jgi:hypothetical protein
VKILKLSLLVVALAFVAIQFIRPARNIAPQPSPSDITALYPTPPAVKQLLAVACYDCHSDTTRYPWYANIQPVAWWLSDHVKEGKRGLNFSAFGKYSPEKATDKLEELVDEINDGEMPLASYKITHADARLTADQKRQLADWADTVRKRILAANGMTD